MQVGFPESHKTFRELQMHEQELRVLGVLEQLAVLRDSPIADVRTLSAVEPWLNRIVNFGFAMGRLGAVG